MATGTISGVTIPTAREHSNRPMLERMLAAAPWLLGMGLRLGVRLPPTSRLRRRGLQQALARGFAAINRGDDWFIPIAYEPDAPIHPAAEFRTVGIADRYRAPDGWQELVGATRDAFPDMRWDPECLIDLGDRVVLRAQMSGSGRTSGAVANLTWGSIYHVSPRGRIARQDMYWSWEATLVAAGLQATADAS